MMARKLKFCRDCNGTGKVFCMNSWFTQDGYRRERCGICAGTGQTISTYRFDPSYIRFQERARAHVAAWGGLKPKLDDPKAA